MLKIKDDVDITTLANYGYLKYGGPKKYYCYHYYIKTISRNSYFGGMKEIFIDADSRKIIALKYDCFMGKQEIKIKRRWIKDLIQAGLVEKVGDE